MDESWFARGGLQRAPRPSSDGLVIECLCVACRSDVLVFTIEHQSIVDIIVGYVPRVKVR